MLPGESVFFKTRPQAKCLMLNNTEVKKAHPGKVKNTDNYHLPLTNKRK